MCAWGEIPIRGGAGCGRNFLRMATNESSGSATATRLVARPSEVRAVARVSARCSGTRQAPAEDFRRSLKFLSSAAKVISLALARVSGLASRISRSASPSTRPCTSAASSFKVCTVMRWESFPGVLYDSPHQGRKISPGRGVGDRCRRDIPVAGGTRREHPACPRWAVLNPTSRPAIDPIAGAATRRAGPELFGSSTSGGLFLLTGIWDFDSSFRPNCA